MLVGTDVYVRMVFVWNETGVPGGNTPVWLGDQTTISHTDVRYRTWELGVELAFVGENGFEITSVPFHRFTLTNSALGASYFPNCVNILRVKGTWKLSCDGA